MDVIVVAEDVTVIAEDVTVEIVVDAIFEKISEKKLNKLRQQKSVFKLLKC